MKDKSISLPKDQPKDLKHQLIHATFLQREESIPLHHTYEEELLQYR